MATTTQMVRDIATENPAAVRVFEKYNIDDCCGGRVPLASALRGLRTRRVEKRPGDRFSDTEFRSPWEAE